MGELKIMRSLEFCTCNGVFSITIYNDHLVFMY